MISEKEFYFIRHGQTDCNLEYRAQGQTDVPLNATGRRQASDAALSVAHLRFGTICSSPLSRAVETAKAISTVTGSEVAILEDLVECSWGVREGERKGIWFEEWKRSTKIPDQAEPYDQFLARATNAINRALEYPGPVLIVAHGGIYWAIQYYALRSMDADLANATAVRHIPPSKSYPWWSTSVVGA